MPPATAPVTADVELEDIHAPTNTETKVEIPEEKKEVFLRDDLPDIPQDDGVEKSAEETSGFFATLFFTWMSPTLRAGKRSQLQFEDLPKLRSDCDTNAVNRRFLQYWPKTGIFKAYYEVVKPDLPILILCALFYTGLPFAGPLLVDRVVSELYLPVGTRSLPWIIGGAIGIGLANMLTQLAGEGAYSRAFRMGVKLNACNITAIYRKTLRLNPKARISSGKIMNHVSSDCQVLFEFLSYAIFIFVMPVQLVVAIYLLSRYVGASVAIIGAVFFVVTPIVGIIGYRFEVLQKAKLKKTDERLKILTDLITGVKLIKLFAWENDFKKRVDTIRRAETNILRKFLYTAVFMAASFNLLPMIMVASTIAIFASVTSGGLDAATILATLGLLDLLRGPLAMGPMAISGSVTATVSTRRIAAFLSLEESTDADFPYNEKECERVLAKLKDEGIDVSDDTVALMRGVNVTYPAPLEEEEEGADEEKEKKDKDEDKDKDQNVDVEAPAGPETEAKAKSAEPVHALRGIDLEVKRGDLVMVIGPVGCGKSTVINALLGEVPIEGDVAVRGSVALVEQRPWIANATVEENVVFATDDKGDSIDRKRLDAVIDASGLRPDIEGMDGGIDSEIGERGTSLSGGQIARVSLARALYANADLVLVDDVLSAVDAHVGVHMFDNIFDRDHGYLRNSACVMVTNHLQFLQRSTRVLILSDSGTIANSGTYQELLAQGVDFGLLATQLEAKNAKRKRLTSATSDVTASPPASPLAVNLDADLALTADGEAEAEAKLGVDDDVDDAQPPTVLPKVKMIKEEERIAGAVPWTIYRDFFKSSGGSLFIGSYLFFTLLAAGASMFTYQWTTLWTDPTTGLDIQNQLWLFLVGFAGILVATVIFQAIQGIMFARGVTSGVTIAHDTMFKKVVAAPMRFFETTPVGRLINRFSRDVFLMDVELGQWLSQSVMFGMQAVVMLGFVTSISWPVVIIIIPVLIVFGALSNYYRYSSREIMRLEGTTKAHVISHIGESVAGATVLRSFKLQAKSILRNAQQMNTNHRAFITARMTARWLNTRIAVLSFIIAIANALIIAFLGTLLNISPSQAGLTMVLLMGTAEIFAFITESFAEVEMRMTSVERIHAYNTIDQEAASVLDTDPPASEWPSEGEITFDQYCTRYRPGLDLVLKGVSFTVPPRAKIGVCGRTGSGKSTITMSLYRIIEGAEGSISIDGRRIDSVGIRTLRERMAIIPQQPTLFNGTMRSNIDPFDQSTDEEIWDVLSTLQLRDVIEAAGGLSSTIEENGSNWSAGQRQLICFSRALLRKAKIFVMDEATASVDGVTDALIQKSVRSLFTDCTVITVAHRLNTIIDCDKVLVMDAGVVGEYDSPAVLLEDKNSLFSALVDETGAESSATLRRLAREAGGGSGGGDGVREKTE